MPRSAGDLLLAAVLALASYAPFEYVAKATLVVAAALFVLDPLPPYSRLVALLSMGVVGLLHRTLQTWQSGQHEEEQEQDEPQGGAAVDRAAAPNESSVKNKSL